MRFWHLQELIHIKYTSIANELGPARAAMSWSEIIFTTVGGLRGAISLILVQQVVTESTPGQEGQKVTAEVGSCPAMRPLDDGHALRRELERSISVRFALPWAACAARSGSLWCSRS